MSVMTRVLAGTGVVVMAAGSLLFAQGGDAAKVVADMRAALGGEAKLAAIKTISASGNAMRAQGETSVGGDYEMVAELPDKFYTRRVAAQTPMGNIVKGLINDGASLGISSRGMGSMKENKDGIMEVQDDFFLATAGDIVADPSAPDAFVRGIMEGVEWVWDNGLLKAQRIEQYKAEINRGARSRITEETAISVFKQFLQDISKR